MDGIKGINNQGSIGQTSLPSNEKTGKVDFSTVLKDAVEKADAVQKEADKTIKEFSAGKVNLHETMIAMEKANLTFQLMLQARNKIVAAYEEIMRTQV
ncbi:MAG: flagellar hook-basal body complex protein FliE [Deltaproteobacteria bacterium]|nr:flagellar hook-basal body complex protein FliE [Deltaproteobacteria bacterium]